MNINSKTTAGCEAWIDVGNGEDRSRYCFNLPAAKKWILEWLEVPSINQIDCWLVRDSKTKRVILASPTARERMERGDHIL